MAARTDLRFDVAALDRASQVFTRMGRAVEAFERRLERLDRDRTSVDIEVDTENATRQVGAFATDMQARLRKAIAALPDIELDADSTDAQRDIARIRAALLELSRQKIGVDIDAADAEARMRLLQAELAGLQDNADVQVGVDATQAVAAIGKVRDEVATTDREVGQFARNLQRDITRAVESLPDIQLDADAGPAHQELARIRGELAALADQRIGIDLDATEAHARAQALERDLRLLGDIDLDVQMHADVAAALAALAAVNGEVDRLDGRTAHVKVDVDKSLADTIVKVAALGRALATLAIPAGLAASLPVVVQLGAALVTATGAIGLVPAAGAAAALGINTLKLAVQGFGDAVAEDDPKKAAEALKALSPAAREAAVAVRAIRPAWDALQLSVQDQLFRGLGKSVGQLAQQYLPALRTTMSLVAGSFNDGAKSITEFLTNGQNVSTVQTAMRNLGTVVDNVVEAAAPLASVLVDVLAEGSIVLRDLTVGAGAAAEGFAGFVREARASGDLAKWIRDGVEQVQQLGRIARDTGAILLNVFSTADDAGAGFLDTVERVVAATREWTASAEGQATIVAVFRSIRDAVDAAAPGVRALVDAIGSVIQQLGDAGVLRAAGEAFSALAAEVAPLVTQIGNLAPLVTTLLGVVRDLAPVLVPAAAAVLGFWAAAKLVKGVTPITTAVSGFVGAIRSIGTVDEATGRVRTLAGALGAGGILGIALAAAGVALSIWAGAQADAAQKVADHKARVDELKGTLDQYTGAATAATRAQVANEVGSKKLADGTTSYAMALQRAGVNLADYTDAASGNEAALGKVRTQLDASTRSVISASPAYKNGESQLRAMGVSLEDLGAAAQGNGPAMDRINSAIASLGGPASESGSAFKLLTDELMRTGGGSAELGRELNTMAGQMAEAQQQARDSATAARDFSTTLDSLKVGFAGLAAGAPQTDLMRDGLVNLATAARDSAAAAAENGFALGGSAGAAAEAERSMAASRAEFLAAADAAGIGKVQAEALADSLGLIPSVARINFETNASETQGQINGVAASFDRVPGTKEVRVQALTDEARGQLEALGLRVETMKDGTFKVVALTDEAKVNLEAFVAGAQNMRADVKVGTQTLSAQEGLAAILAQINAGAATVTINGQSMPAQAALSFALGLVNTSTGTVTINGQDVPARSALSAYIDAVNSGSGTATINGNKVPADQVLGAFLDAVTGARPTVTVGSNASQVSRDLDAAARNRTMTIQVKYAGVRPGSAMGIPIPQAGGGVLGYAAGGLVPARSDPSRGMVIPGYAPGRDEIPIIASRGEAVLVPELTRALGARRILQANAAASGGRPATVIGKVAGMMDGTIRGRAAGGMVTLGEVSSSRWDELRSQGWKGRAGDNVERLYAPPTAGRGGSLGSLALRVRRMAGGGIVDDLARVGVPEGVRDRIRVALETYKQNPAAGAAGLGTVAELRAMLGQLRALRGDVDQGGHFSALIGEIRALRRDLSSGGPSYADTARDAALMGGASWR